MLPQHFIPQRRIGKQLKRKNQIPVGYFETELETKLPDNKQCFYAIIQFQSNKMKAPPFILSMTSDLKHGKSMAKYSHFLFIITQLNTSIQALRFCQDFNFLFIPFIMTRKSSPIILKANLQMLPHQVKPLTQEDWAADLP